MVKKKKTAIEKIMEKSGNGFHARVVNLLRAQKWPTLVSPYYSDNFTDKPREIDIIAVRDFDENDSARATERIMTDTGMDHPSDNINIQELHYFTNVPVAKLFSSEKSRSDDNELMNKAINQNLNALVYYRNRANLMPNDPNYRNQVLRRLSYPIIVVNSYEYFYSTSMADDTGKVEPITDSFQLEANYAYVDKERTGRNEYFLIDVVSIDKLPEFLAMLEKTDVKAVSGKISWEERHKKVVRQNRRGLGNDSS